MASFSRCLIFGELNMIPWATGFPGSSPPPSDLCRKLLQKPRQFLTYCCVFFFLIRVRIIFAVFHCAFVLCRHRSSQVQEEASVGLVLALPSSLFEGLPGCLFRKPLVMLKAKRTGRRPTAALVGAAIVAGRREEDLFRCSPSKAHQNPRVRARF